MDKILLKYFSTNTGILSIESISNLTVFLSLSTLLSYYLSVRTEVFRIWLAIRFHLTGKFDELGK